MIESRGLFIFVKIISAEMALNRPLMKQSAVVAGVVGAAVDEAAMDSIKRTERPKIVNGRGTFLFTTR
jgi:hypothetical protein